MRDRPTTVVSVAVLFAGFGSVSPGPTPTVTVLTSVPLVRGNTSRFAVIVTAPPTGRFALRKKSPIPLVCITDAPPDVCAVQLTVLMGAEGKSSAMLALVTASGPLFTTRIVYVVAEPSVIWARPSDTVTIKSATD